MSLKYHNTASWLWLLGLLGLCGLHRIYLNKKVTGVLWLLTFGLYGLGQVYDMFVLKGMVSESNTKFLTKVKYSSPIFFNYAPTLIQGGSTLPREELVKCEYCDTDKSRGKGCTTCGAG